MVATCTGTREPEPQTAVSCEFPAVPRSVGAARNAVAQLAANHGAPCEAVDDIRLAVSEAATNVVMHAYAEEPDGRFRVLAVVGGDELLVVVEDDGAGPQAPTPHPGLGMGLGLMRRTAQQMQFRSRSPQGAAVQLRFALHA